MSLSEVLVLIAAAAAAGAINAVAGGGTLVTFPALVFFGVSEKIANATSTVALVFGTSGSLLGYRRQIATVRPWLVRFLPVSIVGGWLGSILLTRTSNETFARLIPFLVLFATVLFLAQGAFRRFAGSHVGLPTGRGLLLALVFQFAVAIYGGYFGAGIGILMLASLGFMGMSDIHEMNAVKTVLGWLINLVAAIWFLFAGLVDWSRTGVMTAGALAGYFLASHYSQKIPQSAVRKLIAGIGLAISGVMFYRQFVAN